uniref:Uncharacterized protein n=1 Tax=Rhizophora mucronata TaxID=61149 RepID=A0A2P2NMZ4_RHIMU
MCTLFNPVSSYCLVPSDFYRISFCYLCVFAYMSQFKAYK